MPKPLEFSPALRDAMNDAWIAHIGAEPLLRMYSGTKPALLADAATGDLLAELELPSTWMNASSGGVITKAGTWQDLTADDDGTAGYFRIYDNAGTTAHAQGDITDTAGAGPMKLSSTAIVSGEPVTVVTFTLTGPNADGT
jgi:hypothetical protein